MFNEELLVSTNSADQNIFKLDIAPLQANFLNILKEEGKSINTLKNYKTDLDCFGQYLNQFQDNQRINHISLPQIMEYGKFLETKYHSNNSRRRRVQTLRRFFDYLVTKQIMPSNPVRKIPTSPKFVDIPRPAQFADIKTLWMQLIQESQGESKLSGLIAQRNQVIMLLIYESGLKVSDLAKLTRKNLILGNSPRVIINPLNRDPYSVELPYYFKDLVTHYLTNLDKNLNSSQMNFEELLFNANPYKILAGGISPRGIEIVFEEYRKQLNIEITPKSLRQSCVFKWLHRKISDTTIKEWMGVAPSYGLKPYKDELNNYFFSQEALAELYYHYLKSN